MIYARRKDPPEHLQLEAEKLANEFFAQFEDDDIVPDGAYSEYFYAHGSEELVQYLNSQKETTDDEEFEKE